MNRVELLALLRRHRVAVQTSVTASGAPQAAIVGIAIGDTFEVVFDTLQTSRKAQNLRRNPRIALVLGGWTPGEEQTVQYEGVADEPRGADLERIRQLYFEVYPDGRERLAWPGLIHVRVKPTWLRYSDFNQTPAAILEFSADQLAALI
ncbi:MAG TPA: pyridoxamine 5'-phosphate oxidase family protein [Vicinamibacteria bacterium]|jgi:pyridoxine/pyridoxamine 5'-phosphate oxidase|nr:pyridoxamine 5'-phosphate oxidase family protein [Vicinamibacteria bacterium]